jgi:hypothetical protein
MTAHQLRADDRAVPDRAFGFIDAKFRGSIYGSGMRNQIRIWRRSNR